MQLSDLPTRPERSRLVITPTMETRGLDLLGLRAPAESVALSLMDGVTTISPLVRYLGLRAWMVHRYAELGGPDAVEPFRLFAGKVEAALAYSNELREEPVDGAVGARFAARSLQSANGALPLRPLTQNLALDAYAGPSQDLGITWRRRPVAGLSKERGVPLAHAAAEVLTRSPLLMQIDVASEEQLARRDDLLGLRDALPLDAPAGTERTLLIDAVVPARPRQAELPRVATYGLLLWLCQEHGGQIEETELFEVAVAPNETVPDVFRSSCDGWLRFLVRDCLVAVHEMAVADIVAIVRSEGGGRYVSRERAVGRLLAADWGSCLETAGVPGIGATTAIRDVCSHVDDLMGAAAGNRDITRWEGLLDELALISAVRASAEPGASECLLPIAWIIAERRLRHGVAAGLPDIDLVGAPAIARMGVREVIAPAVAAWRTSGTPMRDVVADLIARSVDQHLRIAWSRLQADPRKDVAVLVSDGSEWMAQADLNPGRAQSRVYQAISWLVQLGLVDDAGTTVDGAAILDRSLSTLRSER